MTTTPSITFASTLHYTTPGAAQSRHRAYFRGLAELGVRVRVLMLGQDTGNAIDNVGSLLEFVPVGPSEGLPRHKRIPQIGLAVKRAVADLRRHPPSAVILLDTHPAILLPLLRAASNMGVPALHERTEHPEVVAPQGAIGQALLRVYYRRCLPQFSGIYAITSPLLYFLLDKAGPSCRGAVVHMIVDTTRFDFAPQTRHQDEVVYAGSLLPHKDGIHILVKALERVRQMPGTGNAHLSMYGPPDGSTTALEFAAELRLPPGSVRIMGQVKPSEIPRILASADALALARPDSMQARYGFPTKLGEYLASGTPTACTAVGEIPSLVEDGVHAYLASPGNVDSFAKALHAALTDADRSTVARNGRRLTDEVFGREQAARQILNLVRRCQEDRCA